MKSKNWTIAVLLFVSLLVNVILISKSDRASNGKPEHSGISDSRPAEIASAKASQEPDTHILDPSDEPDNNADPDLEAEMNALRERVSELNGELDAERQRNKRSARNKDGSTVALSPSMKTSLATPIEGSLRDRSLFEVLELLRSECGLEFIYDPVIQPRLEKMRVDLSIGRLPARKVLNFMSKFYKIEIQYLNQFVWIKMPKKAKPK